MCPTIPVVSEWAQQHLNFQPGPIQKSVLDHEAHSLILCCACQWGKTPVVAIKALHTASFNPGAGIVVISNSLKQAELLLTKVCQSAAVPGFPRKCVSGYANSLHLPNGSKIFAVAGSASPTLLRTNGNLCLLSTTHRVNLPFHKVHVVSKV